MCRPWRRRNESGNYAVTHLIPDVYTVRIEGTGFKSLEYKDVQVSADTGTKIDGQFQVGSTSEQVEVTAEAPQLKTDREDVAVEFTSKQLEELPIFNRNFQSLELLTPGTQSHRLEPRRHRESARQQADLRERPALQRHWIRTGRHGQSGCRFLGIIIVNPSLDSVTETKMTTQNYDAEFGKAIAGILTAQTKSGSNEIHGSGYFYDLDPVRSRGESVHRKAPAK